MTNRFLVKVKIKDILHQTEKATLFLISESEIWLPNKLFRFGKGNYITLWNDIANSKNLDYDTLYHEPEKIEPVYNQQPINELIA